MVVVYKTHRYLYEPKTVHLSVTPDTYYLGNIAVGDEVDTAVTLCPEVIVFYHHHQIASGDTLFALEDTAPYSVVELIGSLIGTSDDDSIFDTGHVVRMLHGFDHIGGGYGIDIVEVDRKLRMAILWHIDDAADMSGVG